MTRPEPAGNDPRAPGPRDQVRADIQALFAAATGFFSHDVLLIEAVMRLEEEARRLHSNSTRLITINEKTRQRLETRIQALITQIDQLDAAHACELSETIDERDSVWRELADREARHIRVLGQRDARIAALDGYSSRLLAWGWQLHLRLRRKIRRERKGIVEEKRSRDRLILTACIVLLFVLWCWVFDWQAGLFSHLNGVAPGGGLMLWVLLALGAFIVFAKTMKGFAGPVFQPSSFEFIPLPADEPEEQVPPPPAAPAVAVAAPAPGAPAAGGAPAVPPVAVAVAAPPAAPAQPANVHGGNEQPSRFYCGRLRYVLLFVLLLGPVWDMLDMNSWLNPWMQSRGVHTLSTVQVEAPAGTHVSRFRIWNNGRGGQSFTIHGYKENGEPFCLDSGNCVDEAAKRR